jgi:hypothetical protein
VFIGPAARNCLDLYASEEVGTEVEHESYPLGSGELSAQFQQAVHIPEHLLADRISPCHQALT